MKHQINENEVVFDGSEKEPNPTWKEVSLSDEVCVKLTDHGEQILKDHLGEITTPWPRDEKGSIKASIADLMRIFGPKMEVGEKMCFEGGTFKLDISE
jgi:hypothetical protein